MARRVLEMRFQCREHAGVRNKLNITPYPCTPKLEVSTCSAGGLTASVDFIQFLELGFKHVIVRPLQQHIDTIVTS